MTMYFRQPTGQVTHFSAVRDTPLEEPDMEINDYVYPMAILSVQHPESIPNFRRGSDGLEPEYFVDDDPETLFTDHPAQITSAFSHSGMRHTIPMLGALAKKEFPGMTAGYDLSPHSSKLTRKAMKLGLIQPHEHNLDAHVTNDFDFADSTTRETDRSINRNIRHGYALPEHEVKAARSYLKHALRPQKSHTDVMGGPQFEQDRIPGVDW